MGKQGEIFKKNQKKNLKVIFMTSGPYQTVFPLLGKFANQMVLFTVTLVHFMSPVRIQASQCSPVNPPASKSPLAHRETDADTA